MESTVQIISPPQWDPKVFTVDCELSKPIFERPCGWVGARSSAQLDAAIAQADRNGGGVVFLPRGQYYIDGPIVVPAGVVIKGEGTQLVSLFFREDNPATAPKPDATPDGAACRSGGAADSTAESETRVVA